jgi:osmotically-inducible protein OsmY
MRNGEYEYYEDSRGWSAFVAGAFMGAAIALLFAPQSGNQLRGIMRNYASRAKDEALEQGKAAWDTAVERGKEFYEKGQDVMQEAGRSAREFTQAGKEAGKEAIKEAAREASKSATAMVAMLMLTFLVALTGCQSVSGKTASQTMNDTSISAAVQTKLTSDRLSDFSRIDVDTERGIVNLSGVVQTEEQRARAEQLARQVDGVGQVNNNLQIQGQAAKTERLTE